MKLVWQQLAKHFQGKNPGTIGAIIGLSLGLSLILFGFLNTLFLLLLTAAGYYLGARYFSDRETIRNWLDKLLPPGKFR